MPIVISQNGCVQYIKFEETLVEILWHSDFDGEDWSIGDRVVFEDGSESRIKQDTGGQAFTWDDPTPADLDDVKRAAGVSEATS